MKKLIIASVVALSGCGLLTPAVESGLNNVGVAVLCSLEAEELADPVLDQDCEKLQSLTPEQKAAVGRHMAKARAAKKPATDGGAQ